MAAVAQVSSSLTVRPSVSRAASQGRRTVMCSAAPKANRNPVKVAFAGFCAAAIVAAQVPMPALAATEAEQNEAVKAVVCASNPTSKICLKDSYKPKQK
mmetsp:Transcript_16311/g.48919  ORF Transcript_16311/g.48919 Transcript_16311/m.48919 type:complete len:99 (-) Transcript_16311:180-476(-)|eukprot:CAMPEP_0206134524 /NCGR_PEP_ID=MMETSP1473-20131121/59_1 /ASSEMBLY_ACC=CAM_ASM_001109 /TAXON_ID=1461547 /ORGANISM="Stichococcus sp, Strain RCC1054" /LENGTH=98 /DNA_ID=CAMNT_0053526139 /DNA_START=83 /DNA_END=379 /DNA_ORIENTATION=-